MASLVIATSVLLRTASPNFRLIIAEGRLDVRPLVVVREEFLAAIQEVPERLGPRAAPAGVRSAERDEGLGARVLDRLDIGRARVALVRADFGHGEVLSGGRDQRGQ